ncbi:uncharacterized protein LOC135109415 [Scylla paramamosain]|uniref:uncharacterized protein LOC135109415 n=1 Tax=Scylla paramamosain TaxID=85552 RepID=UPI0030833FE5
MIREAYDCNKCGRPNCWGDQCEQCASTCWKRIDKTENITKFLMDNQRFSSKLSCNGNWQLWWGKRIKVAKPTPEEALVLHLILVYTDGRELSSYFDSVAFEESGELSVGNLTIDKGAGNWWQAPFSNRPLRRLYNSNCRPFYTPNDTCVSHTTESVEEQRELYNGTVLYLGYAWLTGEQSYDNVPILHINMWVKCAQCED